MTYLKNDDINQKNLSLKKLTMEPNIKLSRAFGLLLNGFFGFSYFPPGKVLIKMVSIIIMKNGEEQTENFSIAIFLNKRNLIMGYMKTDFENVEGIFQTVPIDPSALNKSFSFFDYPEGVIVQSVNPIKTKIVGCDWIMNYNQQSFTVLDPSKKLTDASHSANETSLKLRMLQICTSDVSAKSRPSDDEDDFSHDGYGVTM